MNENTMRAKPFPSMIKEFPIQRPQFIATNTFHIDSDPCGGIWK